MNLNPLALLRRLRGDDDSGLVDFLASKRYLREDVTAFGEALAELHFDTLTDTLDDDAQAYYRHALESYERAKAGLERAEDDDDLTPVEKDLVEGRHQRACVLALVAGDPLPERREECFFNPQHGPSHTEVSWTPPGGVARTVSVCRSDANRLEAGQAPKMRLVRVGDRYVPLAVADDASRDLANLEKTDGHAIRQRYLDIAGQASLYGFSPNRDDVGYLS